ncbi:MAG: AsmA family protein [Betaproteobacteria bacterium]|nr:AsmA family protein [Betaproteobacteria bacterium]
MARSKKWLIGIAGFLVLLFAAIYFFDWNLLKPYIERRVSASTGRTFAINGDLEVHLALRPRIIVNGVVMGNAAWARDPDMARIGRANFKIDLLELLAGRFHFPEIALSEPHLSLEVDKDGKANWVFTEENQGKPAEFPKIGTLTIDHGSARYRDPRINTDLAVEMSTRPGRGNEPESMLDVTGKGRYKGMAATIKGSGGALLSLREARDPYPINANVVMGTTRARVDGVLIDPLHLKGEQLNFSLEKVRAANADVRFRGERIVTENTPLEKMDAHLIVKDGRVTLAPLDFRVAGGNLVTRIEMNARQQRIATHADITAKGLHLDRLFPNSRFNAAGAGTIGGRTKLDGMGNSVAQILGSANGEAALIMDGGAISELLLRLSNLDIANAIAVMIGGDKQIPVRCLVGNFKAVEGNFKVNALLLETDKVNITGDGNANFADEALNLRLVAQSKGFSLVSLRGPIGVTGTFKKPVLRPDMGKVLGRGGLAVALGALTSGVGALIPLLDFGKQQENNCAALISQAKSDVGVKASDIAPRPQGKR